MSTPAAHPSPITSEHVIQVFNAQFQATENTCLCGGADEPYYEPAIGQKPAIIWFRADYVRSALHEVAHWCLAGSARRDLADYGYWYTSDDRNTDQQTAFFAVEARPQALERYFCEALKLSFRASVDNLSLTIVDAVLQGFNERIARCHRRFAADGLPKRAALFCDGLSIAATAYELSEA